MVVNKLETSPMLVCPARRIINRLQGLIREDQMEQGILKLWRANVTDSSSSGIFWKSCMVWMLTSIWLEKS